MPIWSNELPALQKHMGFDLRRTPSTGRMIGIITSDDMLVVPTHYWNGRTCPHEEENCQACLNMMPYRIHVYVSCFDPKTREHYLYESTSNAAKSFEEHKKAFGTLRGCMFQAERPKQTRNGKVVIMTKPADLTKISLPEPPNLIRAMSVIWNIPVPDLAEPSEHLRGKHPKIRRETMEKMREQPDNKPEPESIGSVLSNTGLSPKKGK
jgi:hypothetical protein